jgi:hypothetical protein
VQRTYLGLGVELKAEDESFRPRRQKVNGADLPEGFVERKV